MNIGQEKPKYWLSNGPVMVVLLMIMNMVMEEVLLKVITDLSAYSFLGWARGILLLLRSARNLL